jgi:hypothetical protein
VRYGSTLEEEVVSTQCCVVYEMRSGKIRLVYEEVTFEGGAQTSEDEFRRMIHAVLLELPPHEPRIDLETHGVLLQKALLEPGVSYRVDVAEEKLVRIEASEPLRG